MSTIAPLSPWHGSAAPGAGREYTFGQLVCIAVRRLWRQKGWAILIALLLGLIDGLFQAGVTELYWHWPRLFLTELEFVIRDPSPPMWVEAAAIRFTKSLAYGFGSIALTEVLLWTIIAGLDRGRPACRDLLQPLRPAVRGTFLRYVAMFATSYALAMVLAMAAERSMKFLVGANLMGCVVSFFADATSTVSSALLGVIFLLAGAMILSQRQPTVRGAVREYWRVLARQPGRMWVAVGLWAIVAVAMSKLNDWAFTRLLPWFSSTFPAAPSAAAVYGLYFRVSYQIAYSLLFSVVMLPYTFLVATLFRAAYGLPLEPESREPQAETAP